MVTDNISDMLARVKNGYRSGAQQIRIPHTKAVKAVLKVMEEEGYVGKVEDDKDWLNVTLKYQGKDPAIMGVRRFSRPGARRYASLVNIPKVWGGLGINILSTDKGVISSKKAKKLNAGGEIVCQIW